METKQEPTTMIGGKPGNTTHPLHQWRQPEDTKPVEVQGKPETERPAGI